MATCIPRQCGIRSGRACWRDLAVARRRPVVARLREGRAAVAVTMSIHTRVPGAALPRDAAPAADAARGRPEGRRS